MRATKRPKATGGIDLSPMLDVIFQLILFFLVSTTFATLPGIAVNLPQSTTAQGTDASGLTITVDADGAMFVNDQSVTFKTIEAALKKIDTGKLTRETYPVTVSADDKVTNGTIVKIFDALRKTGFSSVSLRTKTIK